MLDYPKVKNLLRKQGFTQKEVAAELNVSATAVSDWLKGESQPSKENLEGLAGFLDCNVDELTTNKPEVSANENKGVLIINFYGEKLSDHLTIHVHGEEGVDLLGEDNQKASKKRISVDIDPEVVDRLEGQEGNLNKIIQDLLKKHLSQP